MSVCLCVCVRLFMTRLTRVCYLFACFPTEFARSAIRLWRSRSSASSDWVWAQTSLQLQLTLTDTEH